MIAARGSSTDESSFMSSTDRSPFASYRGAHREGSHIEKIRRLLTVIAGVAILGGLGLAAAGPAAASSGPYVDAHATGWAHPQVRPTFITVGNGCAPQEHHLQWSHWGKYTAFGTSDDVLFPPACSPHSGSLYL